MLSREVHVRSSLGAEILPLQDTHIALVAAESQSGKVGLPPAQSFG
jgi:hypothetical protein